MSANLHRRFVIGGPCCGRAMLAPTHGYAHIARALRDGSMWSSTPTGCVFRCRGGHRPSAERSPKYGTRRCKFVPGWVADLHRRVVIVGPCCGRAMLAPTHGYAHIARALRDGLMCDAQLVPWESYFVTLRVRPLRTRPCARKRTRRGDGGCGFCQGFARALA